MAALASNPNIFPHFEATRTCCKGMPHRQPAFDHVVFCLRVASYSMKKRSKKRSSSSSERDWKAQRESRESKCQIFGVRAQQDTASQLLNILHIRSADNSTKCCKVHNTRITTVDKGYFKS